MTTPLKYFAVATIGALIAVTWFAFAITARANPSFFVRQQTASATSTVTYITPGAATTTLTYDTGNGAAQGADSAALMVQFNASGTLSVLQADIQYSQDGTDWYATSFAWNPNTTVATSSPSIGTVQQFNFGYASSTINRGANTTATTTRIVVIPTPTRYVRAVFTLAPGSPNGVFWAEFIGKRQNP